MRKRISTIFLVMIMLLGISACKQNFEEQLPDTPEIEDNGGYDDNDLVPADPVKDPSEYGIYEDGLYISKEEVGLYIYFFGKLPGNYRTKSQIDTHIRNYWTEENMLSVGGDRFYNREGLLPNAEGRLFYEADIDYRGESGRNAKRIVFSNDGLIFYTNDHYKSFIQFDTENLIWN